MGAPGTQGGMYGGEMGIQGGMYGGGMGGPGMGMQGGMYGPPGGRAGRRRSVILTNNHVRMPKALCAVHLLKQQQLRGNFLLKYGFQNLDLILELYVLFTG